VTVANSTAAIDVLPSSRRNEGIGYYGMSNNLAMAIAPSVGIFIYKYTESFELLFWLALAIALIGMIIDSTLKYETNNSKPKKSQEQETHKLFDRFFLTRGWLIAVNMVFYGLCFGILSNYLAIYSKEVMGITGGTGTYFIILAVGLIASRLQGSKALRQGKLTMNAAEGTILSTVGYLLFVACPNEFGYYGSALFLGLGNGHIWPAFQNMVISIAQHNQRGTANSTLLVSWDVGMGLGVLVGGFVSEHFGYSSAFWTVAAAQICGTLLFLFATKDFFNKRKLTN
jgi:predicted MFS family arabinose efflux permease